MASISSIYSDYFNTISGSIKFTGLASGTDFDSVVDQLVELESIQMERLETWRTEWEAKVEAISSLNDRLKAIGEAAGAMDTSSEFLVRQGSSSNTSVVTATGTSSAATGAYIVQVGSDVKHIMQSGGVATADATAIGGAAGTLSFTIGGASYDVTGILAGDSLTTLAGRINAQQGTVVEATVVSDGTSSRPYHLVIKSKTGGDDGRVIVTYNPTDLSLGYQDVVMQSDWSGASTTSISLAGQFTGDKADAEARTYSFAVTTGGGPFTVGTDAFTLQATRSTGGTVDVDVPADYTPGQSLEVEEGFFIQLSAGTVVSGDGFVVRAFANDIDEAQVEDWEGPAITTSGNYLGAVNKTYTFTVVQAGTLGDATPEILRWTDSTGDTGTVTVTDSGTAYEVEDGVYISFAAGDLIYNDKFTLNVFSPDKQQGQDEGMAQVAKVVHAGFGDDAISSVTSGNAYFYYTYNGQQRAVAVSAGMTLSQLKSLINYDTQNPGVVASIVNDGQGLPTSYHLVLTGENSGAQYQITDVHHTFTGSGFDTGGDVGGGFTLTQRATNSMIKVDGYPSTADEYLQRASNTIGDVITGVALSLQGAGTATITISNNVNSIASNIEAFINAVNYAQDYIREQTQYDPDGEETGVLIGNYSFYIIKSRIDSILNSSISGLTDGVDAYTHLSQIGIHTDPNDEGRWVIDSSTLTTALNTDAEAVANLFVSNATKGTEGAAKQMYDEMVTMTDSDTGMLNVLLENYDGIIENIDKRIDSEEKRIVLYRQRMEERFARLEATLTELEGISSSLESQIAQLPGNSSD